MKVFVGMLCSALHHGNLRKTHLNVCRIQQTGFIKTIQKMYACCSESIRNGWATTSQGTLCSKTTHSKKCRGSAPNNWSFWAAHGELGSTQGGGANRWEVCGQDFSFSFGEWQSCTDGKGKAASYVTCPDHASACDFPAKKTLTSACCHGEKVLSENEADAELIHLVPRICKSFWKDISLPFYSLFQGSASPSQTERHLSSVWQSSRRNDDAQHLYPQPPTNQISRQRVTGQDLDLFAYHLSPYTTSWFPFSDRKTSQLNFCRY